MTTECSRIPLDPHVYPLDPHVSPLDPLSGNEYHARLMFTHAWPLHKRSLLHCSRPHSGSPTRNTSPQTLCLVISLLFVFSSRDFFIVCFSSGRDPPVRRRHPAPGHPARLAGLLPGQESASFGGIGRRCYGLRRLGRLRRCRRRRFVVGP